MRIKFRYIDYNDNKNYILETIEDYTNKNTLVITEDGMSKKILFAAVNNKKMRIFNSFLSFDEFQEKIFFSEKNILKDIKRFLLFYSCLEKDTKEKLNIRTYYDCIEIADDFFEFFKYIEEVNILENLNLSKWQIEKIELFYKIKESFDKILSENNYLPLDWLYKKENLDLFYLRNFERIVFYDIVDFPYNYYEILKEISNNIEVEIVLQMKKGNFDENKLKIKNLDLPDRNMSLFLNTYKNDFELYNLVQKENSNNLEVYSANINREDNYSIFSSTNKYLFNDTKLYKILESYINILENIDLKTGLMDLFKLKEQIFNADFMEFYGLDIEDYKNFQELLEKEYRYISYELLEQGYFDFSFKENKNLLEKLKFILKSIQEIERIKNIEDLNIYFKNKFFSNDDDINFFMEAKYLSIYDKFYEILGILNSNENTDYFKNFSKFFEKNIGKNIFILFFNHLNKIVLYGNESSIEEDKIILKDLYNAKFSQKNDKKVLLIHTDNQNLPRIKKNNALFTEQQKQKIGIKSYDDLMQIEKYRTFQNILNFQELYIYSVLDLDNNIDFSAFIYEYTNKYKAIENEKESLLFIDNFFVEDNSNIEQKEARYRAYRKELSDFKDGVLKIGAYDYTALLDGETFFFLNKLCKLQTQEELEEVNGISLKLLGIILHKTLENLFKKNWKSILKSTENILIYREEILEELKSNIRKEYLKFENFMSNYLEEVLIEKLVNNIEKFLKFLYEELKEEKIIRIEAEKKDKTEVPFYEINGIQVLLTGRADLLVESSKGNYIIDFKTGFADKRQLEFYTVMFYGKELTSLPVYAFAYNFWKEGEAENIEIEKYKMDDIAGLCQKIKDSLKKFFENPNYALPKKSALKEYKADFKKLYNYKYLCPLDKIQGDENE